MLAKYFSIIRNYVLLVSSQREYTKNPSIVIPLLANQGLMPMLLL